MTFKPISIALISAFSLLGLGLVGPADAVTIRVPADQPNIQAGIDAATPGDVVLVAPGTYSGTGNKNLDFRGKAIAVRSETGPQTTTIDCEGSGRGWFFFRGETSASVVDGFTMRRGFIDAMGGGGAGMLMIFASPTILNCVFVENSAISNDLIGGGGAISCRSSSSEIRNCVFRDNTMSTTTSFPYGQGGALLCLASALTVIDCVFEDNRSLAGDGGGAFVYPFQAGEARGSTTSFQGCSFINNQARDGGGLVAIAEAIITDCTFTDNHANRLGGGMNGGVGITVEDCVATGNSATFGGGFYLEGAAMERCVLVANTATGHAGGCWGNPLTMTSCTLVGNSAPAGSSVSSQGVTITNSILAFGGPGSAVQCLDVPTTVACSDIYGHAGGDWIGCLASQLGVNGNISADPLFCSRPQDLHLCSDSPCAPGASGCDLIGALEVACSVCGATAVEPSTWGRIKAELKR